MKTTLWMSLCLWIASQYAIQAQGVMQYREWHHEGKAQMVAGDYVAAIASFDKAIQRMPYYVTMYFDRADAKVLNGQYKEAIGDYNYVLEKQQRNYKAFRGRGIANYHLNNFDAAERDLRECLKYSPVDMEAQKYLNYVLEEKEALAQQAAMERARQQALNQQYQARREAELRRYRTAVVAAAVVPVVVWAAWRPTRYHYRSVYYYRRW
ncbi:tetratricopeptide repeat protein [Eisenibacter elegans]|jgi:tetratricopeptide (TPR) repeat protein|uniref:tetratricopeptide repeat protein n=1 Tax=Eisenibacter elegans TaxID=997 RepID=UPI0004180058|nr:tetratricopeptide repeat protein [Eisenibacter elegans]